MNWDDSWTRDLRSKWFKRYHQMRTLWDDISGDVRPSETLFVSTCLCVALCHREDIPTPRVWVSGSLGGSWISMPKVPRQFGNLFQRNKKKDAYIMYIYIAYIYMYEYINLLILKRCAIQNDSFNHIPELNSAPFCRYSAVGTLDGDSGDAKKSNRHAHAWRLRPSGLPRPSPLPTFKVQKLQEVLGIWLNLHNFAKFILHSFRILPLSTHLDMKLEFRSMDTFELSPSLLAGGSRNEKSSYEEKMLCVKLLTCQFACWCASCPSFDLFRKRSEWEEQNINCHETRGNRSSCRSCHEWW